MIKNIIAEMLKQAVQKAVESKSLGAMEEIKENTLDDILIDKTKKPEFGDYCCNVSFLAREAKIPPAKIAEQIINNIDPAQLQYFSTSIIGGFINFYLKSDLLSSIITEILGKQTDYGRCKLGNNTKVLLEYVSANPTGPLHIGHGRWAALGSSIENIMNHAGYDVETEFYINDAGVQIRNLGYSLFLRIMQQVDNTVYFPLDKETDPRSASFYPGNYVIAIAKRYINENPSKPEEFKQRATIDDNLYIPPEELITELALYAKPLILEQQKLLLERFGTTFKIWYSEASLYDLNKVASILDYLQDKDVLYEKEGAIWFASSRFLDTQDRVVKKSDGTLTYLTADIAYHKDKFDRGYEHLINIWGADHHGYVPRMKSAVQALGHPPDSLEVIIGQMVNLIIDGEQVRMGKRKKMLTLEDLIDEVGVDATRFWMISRSTDSTLDFDIELAKSASDENPVYYVQYAHARCCSILRNVVAERIDTENKQVLPPIYTKEQLNDLLDKIKNQSELLNCLWDNLDEKQNLVTRQLVLKLEAFKDIVLKAARDRSPHYVARYLLELATCFHSFYTECRVLNLSQSFKITQELQNARIAVIDATRQILYNGLKLVGVSAPESM